MKAKYTFSGDMRQDILKINNMDEIDYSLFDLNQITYVPYNTAKLQKFLETHKRIVFCADSDADGLGAAGVVKCYFPKALIEFGERNDNRGLTIDVYEQIKSFYSPDAIITLDCGITNFDGIAAALRDGVDVFVTDHHKPEQQLPDCDIINPWLENLYFSDYCGSGVIYFALAGIYGENTEALQYATIGTICDVVTLAQDNRSLVKRGLELINTEPALPIKNTLSALGLNGTITEKKIGWYFGPAVNAASRLNSTDTAVRALLFDDLGAAKELKELNVRRKALTKQCIETAQIDVYGNIVIVHIADGLSGLTGLVAMRLAGVYKKSVCVFTKNKKIYHASLRTLDTWNATELIQSTKLINGGGHSGAAGFSSSESDHADIIQALIEFADKQPIVYTDAQFEADIEIAIVDAARNYSAISSLAPYGAGFKTPVFKSTAPIKADDCKFTANGHLSIVLSGYQAYYYNPPQLEYDNVFDIAYELEYNDWKRKPQIIILRVEKL